MNATGDLVVAKPKGRPRSSQRNDVTAKIDAGVITKAKFVADTRGVPLAEYLTELLRGSVDRDFAKAVKQVDGSDEK